MKNVLEKSVSDLNKKVDVLIKTVQKGFGEFRTDIDNLAIMVKNGFDDVRSEMNDRFNKVEYRLDRIENISVAGHERRIEILEDNIRLIKTKLELKNS